MHVRIKLCAKVMPEAESPHGLSAPLVRQHPMPPPRGPPLVALLALVAERPQSDDDPHPHGEQRLSDTSRRIASSRRVTRPERAGRRRQGVPKPRQQARKADRRCRFGSREAPRRGAVWARTSRSSSQTASSGRTLGTPG